MERELSKSDNIDEIHSISIELVAIDLLLPFIQCVIKINAILCLSQSC